MRTIILLLMGFMTVLSAQTVPNLPIFSGGGTTITWNDSIYFFGGSSDWNGIMRHLDVYKFDGSTWSYHDSIPDDAVWDMESVLVGDEVFLLSGWPNGGSLIRKYHLPTSIWTNLTPGPNTRPWGGTAEHVGGFIYLFHPSGAVYEYNIGGDSWMTKTRNSTSGYFGLSSTVYQDEVYIAGFHDSTFYKYTPVSDSWTQLANIPTLVVACVTATFDNKIYCIGGGKDESPTEPSDTVLVYDVFSDSWAVDRFKISGKRQWMADTEYHNSLYILGGYDSSWSTVDIVEEIVPLGPIVATNEPSHIPTGISLGQNYPNPFNPTTTIGFTLPSASVVTLEIFNVIGQQIVGAYRDTPLRAGTHNWQWNATNANGNPIANGVYFYRLTTDDFVQTRKMLLVR